MRPRAQRNPLDHKLRVMFTAAKSIGASIYMHDHDRGVAAILESWAKQNGLRYIESIHQALDMKPWINGIVDSPPNGGAIIGARVTVLHTRLATDDEIAAQDLNS